MTAVAEGTRSRALSALDRVRDPELDEPITTLGFVESCHVSAAGDVVVRLRLPTYFCAANFAFLMVADAYDVLAALPGIRSVDVTLLDHFAGDQINAGVAARAGFVASFDGEAAAELDELRRTFVSKAMLAGTDQVCRPLVAAGTDPAELSRLTLGDVPASPELDRLRRRRVELGLPDDDTAPLLVDPGTGTPIAAAGAPKYLGLARLTRTGIEANTGICRGMLRHRYTGAGAGEEE
ncbi:iron-sulfur cluster assembly protein [Kribbella sp. NPDC055071]